MELIIKEISDIDRFKNEPISYRVSISIGTDNNIILTREYFRVGFNDGESWNKFYFNCDSYSYGKTNLTRASFITRKIDDKQYLQNKELELINKFYDKLIETKNLTIKEFLETQKRINNKISLYDNMINFFDKYKRKDKILKIYQYN